MASEDLKIESSKIKSWISKGENGELQSSKEARVLAEKAKAKYESKDARDKLFREVFGTYVNKESYSAEKGKPFTVDSSDAGKGLLEALSKHSPILSATFKSFSDTRLLAYQNLFFKFEAQGADVNVLPIGAKVSLKDGVVTVEYPNGKKVSAMLFPWEEAQAQVTPQVSAEKVKPVEAVKPIETHAAPVMPVTTAGAPTIEKNPSMNFEEDWAANGVLAKSIKAEYPQLKIADKSADYAIGFDRPKGTKKVQISNNITGESYIIEITPKKGATNYQDPEKLNFSVTKMIDGGLGIRDDKKSFKFDSTPKSVMDALEACAKYTSEIRYDNFSLDTHIRLSTTTGGVEIAKMNPEQKLTYIRSLLSDAKKKYERITKDPVLGKKEKIYLDSVRAEVTFLKAAYEDLPKKSDDVDALFSYFDSKLAD